MYVYIYLCILSIYVCVQQHGRLQQHQLHDRVQQHFRQHVRLQHDC